MRPFLAIPRLRLYPRRLLLAPRVEVEGATAGTRVLRVHGLACPICAARTRAALASVPGVAAVSVDFAAGTARLRLAAGGAPDRVASEAALLRALQAALDRVVVGRGARRWVERAISRRRGTRA